MIKPIGVLIMKKIKTNFVLLLFAALFSVAVSAQTSTLQRLEAKIVELETVVLKQQATIDRIRRNKMLKLQPYVKRQGNTIIFEGVNLQVTNGSGFTNTANGTGNLIIGYDETSSGGRFQAPVVCSNGRFETAEDCTKNNHVWSKAQKTGSHNLIVGSGHSYTQSAGVVFGAANAVTGANAVVLGGSGNVSSATVSVVSGGKNNIAKAGATVVSGGESNIASADSASVSGGKNNHASAATASIGGGTGNQATAISSSVVGGEDNMASGENASITGGSNNIASGAGSSVDGGIENQSLGDVSAISGGSKRQVSGKSDWIAGDLILFQDR